MPSSYSICLAKSRFICWSWKRSSWLSGIGKADVLIASRRLLLYCCWPPWMSPKLIPDFIKLLLIWSPFLWSIASVSSSSSSYSKTYCSSTWMDNSCWSRSSALPGLLSWPSIYYSLRPDESSSSWIWLIELLWFSCIFSEFVAFFIK